MGLFVLGYMVDGGDLYYIFFMVALESSPKRVALKGLGLCAALFKKSHFAYPLVASLMFIMPLQLPLSVEGRLLSTALYRVAVGILAGDYAIGRSSRLLNVIPDSAPGSDATGSVSKNSFFVIHSLRVWAISTAFG